MLRVLSLGAGVQSSTLALMSAAGELPMMDCAIFADTQSEPRAVYEWLAWLETQLPFPVHHVTKGNLGADILADAKAEVRFMLPTFTADGGMGKRQCTRAYKIRPIRRMVRLLAARQQVEQHIGISLDESWRVNVSGVRYITNVYPLIERKLTRQHCIDWLWEKFQRRAPKSSCKFCPFRDDKGLAVLEQDEMAEVIGLDEFVRHRAAEAGQIQFLHRSRRPMRVLDLKAATAQTDLFINECEGMCGV